MLPRSRLLNPHPLYSGRQQTFYTPETLFLSVGIGQPVNRPDDAFATLVHEGIHWRQFHGTTFGAFCQWLKHSQELNTFQHLRALPDEQKHALLFRRAAGTPILSLDPDTDLPDPPISGLSLRSGNRLDLLRSIFFDHLFTYSYFRNSIDVVHEPSPAQDMFGSAIADAAATVSHEHPSWDAFEYADVQSFYTLPKVGKVKGLDRELATRDMLEAAAAANEIIFHALIVEQRFLLTDEGAQREIEAADKDPGLGQLPPGIGPDSVAWPRDAFDYDTFGRLSASVLESSYGVALKFFFKASGLSPARPESWVTALAIIDFSLNGPLPPLVLPGHRRPSWDDLYPPARFLQASVAVRKTGPLPLLPDHRILSQFTDDIARAAHLSSPNDYDYAVVFDKAQPDFDAIKKRDVWDELYGEPVNYYSFLRWCQQALWTMRQADSLRLVIPVMTMWSLMRTNMPDAYSFIAGRLGTTCPLVFAADGEIEHALGSTTQFGTWLALSAATFHSAWELMTGVGKPAFAGFPQTLFSNEASGKVVDGSVRHALGISFDPWLPAQHAGTGA